MSEQKMREALDYIAGLALADDARDLPTIAATAQEALVQPDDVGLTDDSEVVACAERIKKAIGKENSTVAMKACYLMMQVINFPVVESKKNGGAA